MPTALTYWFHAKGVPGFRKTISQQGPTDAAPQNYTGVIPAMAIVDTDGAPVAFGGGDASAANQTNGGQKTQLVGAAGGSSVAVKQFNQGLSPNDYAMTGQVHGYNFDAGVAGFVSTVGNALGTYVVDGFKPAGTDRSGTAGTTATQLAAANTSRRKLTIQNVSTTATLYVNEVGGTATAGAPGTNSLGPGATMSVSTNRPISVAASAAATNYTALEI